MAGTFGIGISGLVFSVASNDRRHRTAGMNDSSVSAVQSTGGSEFWLGAIESPVDVFLKAVFDESFSEGEGDWERGDLRKRSLCARREPELEWREAGEGSWRRDGHTEAQQETKAFGPLVSGL